jgi:hypothetical protein
LVVAAAAAGAGAGVVVVGYGWWWLVALGGGGGVCIRCSFEVFSYKLNYALLLVISVVTLGQKHREFKVTSPVNGRLSLFSVLCNAGF